jgi:hypothetical protein
MKWTVYTRDESVMPAIEGPNLQQYASKDDALQQAWELMYGRTRRPRMTILRIEGPNGELVGNEEIEAYFKQRSGK